jgi:hypothetical protein
MSPPAHMLLLPLHETLRFDIEISTARIRCGLILTYCGKRRSAISLANDSGECFEPLGHHQHMVETPCQ